MSPGAAAPEIVTQNDRLKELIQRLVALPRYALDTEFHRERTYWPRLALVQVAWPPSAEGPAGVALIDPLAVDVAALADLLAGPGTMVAHAAEQDLEVLERACGRGPGRLFDTQVAAGFNGHGSASLASLTATYLGVSVTKGDRLTDWSRRPLGASQLAYAASDVDRLLDLADAVGDELDRRGRREWAEQECSALLARPRRPAVPEQVWWRIRDNRQLRGASRGVAQELAAWRERRARELDLPPRLVLPDLPLQAMAQRPPRSIADLREVRGLDGRYLRDGVGPAILAAVQRGHDLPASALQVAPVEEVSRHLRPAVALGAAWVAQLARDEHIDAALLATRADLVAYLRGDANARLGQGWREALVGRRLRRLVDGDASLAVAAGGRLVLEERSRRPL